MIDIPDIFMDRPWTPVPARTLDQEPATPEIISALYEATAELSTFTTIDETSETAA